VWVKPQGHRLDEFSHKLARFEAIHSAEEFSTTNGEEIRKDALL